MNESVRGEYAVIGESTVPVKELKNIKPPEGSQIYEVIRIQESTPLFLTDHVFRLQSSATRISEKITDEDIHSVKSGLSRLIEANEFSGGNIKIMVSYDQHQPRMIMYFLPHQYPSKERYAQGIKAGLFHATRSLPDAKIANTTVRDAVNGYLEETGFFEALLVDDKEFITEGSRSNVFFLTDENTLVTAPDEFVLSGITRKYVIDIIRQTSCMLDMRKLHLNELSEITGAFITGTSPKVMPVQQIGRHTYPVGHVCVKKIMEVFDQCIQADINATHA